MKAIIVLALLFGFKLSRAETLQSEPVEVSQNQELKFSFRSDLWTRTSENKDTPVRLYSLGYRAFLLKQSDLQLRFFAQADGFSSGRTDLIVGPTRTLVGSDLRDQKIGAQLVHALESGAKFALKLAYESASDQPFQDDRDTSIETTLNYKWPLHNEKQFFIEANNSKNRGVWNSQVVVLPGVILKGVGDWDFYISPLDLRALYGKENLRQYEIRISPMESYMRFEQEISETLSYEARLALRSRAYLNVDRTEDSMRVFFEESVINNIFKFKLSEATSVEVNAGYAFNRFLYEGKQVYLPIGKRSTMPSDFIGGVSWRFVF